MIKNLLRDRRVVVLLTLTVCVVAVSSVSALASSPRTVKVHDGSYGPRSLTVTRGTAVTWKWVGVLRHNVVVRSGPSKFRSRIQVRGTFSHVFTRRGTYHLFCTIHPYMKMTVVVR